MGSRNAIFAAAIFAHAIFATALVARLVSPRTFADPKTGDALNKISLPSGPGSIEGLGDAFKPQLNCGTSAYSVTFKWCADAVVEVSMRQTRCARCP